MRVKFKLPEERLDHDCEVVSSLIFPVSNEIEDFLVVLLDKELHGSTVLPRSHVLAKKSVKKGRFFWLSSVLSFRKCRLDDIDQLTEQLTYPKENPQSTSLTCGASGR